MRRHDTVTGALTIAIGAGILWQSQGLKSFFDEGTPGEAFWPTLIAAMLVFFGLLLLVNSLAFARAGDGDGGGGGGGPDLWAPAVRSGYLGALLALAFAGAIMLFGFVAMAPVFMAGLMVLMGERRPLVIVPTALATVAIIWLAFVKVFNITLPSGAFF
ncbi:MAG: tripartite tricarboxylate transporter TctB family protein [Tropicimonas sp.]|uniref:tripartite tricarboxylate transporter TctB family protein n=1 Tax=Tropicimonas sp. TaxID=2067044 RepID=UPI003A8B0E7B